MKLFILTGAGLSAESGLGTFRDKGGLWSRFDLDEVATPSGFARNPDKVHEFYNLRRSTAAAAMPNAAHHALAQLAHGASAQGIELFLCTQNVDDLHERAGSTNVVHMHGSLFVTRCEACDVSRPWHDDLTTILACPNCGVAGALRPGVVWFGELPLHMDEINAALADCDLFVAIGTSGTVYPAAGFVLTARQHGARTMELNLERSQGHAQFDEIRLGQASETVPLLVDDLLGGAIL